MKLHKKIKETRIQEICDKFIENSIKNNKPISKEDVASLSCAELIVLYHNTEWLIERSKGDNINTGLENQIMLMDLIKERIKESTLYVLYTDATNLPFFTDEKSILVYTEKRPADMVACYFNVEYFKELVRFNVVQISNNKEIFWQKIKSSGISKISVDGTKFTINIQDLIEEDSNYENAELCRFLIQYAQAMRLGIHRDKISIFQDAIILSLKDNPMIVSGPVVTNGKDMFLPLYVNTLLTNENEDISKLKPDNFYKICNDIFNNKYLNGIVLNPEREHIFIPIEKIAEAFSFLDTKSKKHITEIHNKEKMSHAVAHCSKCGKLWKIETLDYTGLCPNCVKNAQQGHKTPILRKPQKMSANVPTSSLSESQIKNTVNSPNLDRISQRPKMIDNSPKETNYALWCMVCGFISLLVLFVSVIAFDNASKAIKQAKKNGEAVSSKVWIGIITSIFSLLFFTLFIFIPIIMD